MPIPDYNFHPVLAHFPFVLIISVLILELLYVYYKKSVFEIAAKINLYLYLAFLLVAFFSGYQGITYANLQFSVPSGKIESHHNLAKFLLFFSVVPLAFKLANFRNKIFYFLSLIIAVIFTAYVSYLGSRLVFDYGAGVQVLGEM